MIANKFIQWNPAGTNQETDAAYLADTQRSGGALGGQDLYNTTANKLWYQLSTAIAALAQAMANKGIATDASNFDDASLANLVTAFTNILTAADFAFSATSPGYLSLPAALGGFIFQWGYETGVTPPTVVTYPIPFPNGLLHLNIASREATPQAWGTVGSGLTTFTAEAAGTGTFSWFAIGF